MLGATPLFETTLVFPNAPKNKPNYRIPSILQAPNGDILIIAEKRNARGDARNEDDEPEDYDGNHKRGETRTRVVIVRRCR